MKVGGSEWKGGWWQKWSGQHRSRSGTHGRCCQVGILRPLLWAVTSHGRIAQRGPRSVRESCLC